MLEVKGISKSYGTHQAIEDISFKIEQGEVVGFLGINGAGKSTTMNIMTGYISASEGDVYLDGADILTEPLKAKEKIGYLPEQPPVYPEMKVKEYLEFLYDLKKVKRRKLEESKSEHIEKISRLVKIESVSGRMIKNLSKGYRQRVGLGGALIGNPEILILDEPTVGLDPAQIIEIRNLIKNLAKEHTVLLSSHILSEVQMVCGRIIILHEGRIVADDTPDNLSTSLKDSGNIKIDVEGCMEEVIRALNEIPEINEIKDLGLVDHLDSIHHYNIKTDGGIETRRKIFYKLSEKGFAMLSMRGDEKNLEEIFLSLTSGEQGLTKTDGGIETNGSDL